MLIIVSKDISSQALTQLEKYGEVLLFGTNNITYKAIQNHPDIFLCQHYNTIFAAPNTPQAIIDKLLKSGISVVIGHTPVGSQYPQTALYNAVLTKEYLIHNHNYTDVSIKNNCSDLKYINIKQGYTRCNLLALPNHSFITSDIGIENILKKFKLKTLYINPKQIILEGFSNGFFGGCCGTTTEHVFVNGSLSHLPEKKEIELFIENAQLNLIELTNSLPHDVGGIFFV